MKDHILVVDDDSQVTSFLQRFFKKHGYNSTGVGSAAGMFEVLKHDDVDLVVLDLILPDEDGLEAARRLQQTSDVPIIMLSARDELHDRIVGLELGADDYVTKPYEPRELLARVRSVLRRRRKQHSDAPSSRTGTGLVQIGGVSLDFVAFVARRMSDGMDLGLTSTEFTLLRALTEAGGDILTRDAILNTVYGNSVQITDRAIDAHIVRLRRKLAVVDNDSDLIVTVHGKGYRLAARPKDI
ncbi:MAG: response regulator transcription factor [Rhodobacteraceae bacterium]|nr:response regulator transcription factor [Paracoccaceae bacterium]